MLSIDSQIQDANIKLAIRAVDLETNNSKYMTSGSAVKAVIASSAILSGYNYDGHNYIDGDYDPETGVLEHKKWEQILYCCVI